MIKKVIFSLLTLAIIGGSLFFIGNKISADEILKITDIPTHIEIENDKIDNQKSKVDDGINSLIDSFTDINVVVMSADIYLIYGDKYSLDYNIHDREKIKIFDVSNEILNFNTSFNLDFKVDYGDWYVKVTVPKDAKIGDINLKTVSGNIIIEDAVLKTANLKSTSGEVKIISSKIDMLEIKTISNKILIKDSTILNVKAKNTSDNIILTGRFSDVDINSVSGNIKINGSISDFAKIDTISGNIDFTSTVPLEVVAESVGKIKYNNNNQGYKFNNSKNNNFHLKSVSGKIQINDK